MIKRTSKVKDINTGNKVANKEVALDFTNPKYYLNRELSLLEFNYRVLLEAQNKKHPLLERLKFAVILSSNLDEFFMIRVAGLKSQLSEGIMELSYDGKTPARQLQEIRKKLLGLYQLQEDILMNEIFPEMEQNDIFIHQGGDLIPKELEYFREFFCEQVLPILTPLSLGPAHPFPRLINRSLNIVFVIKSTNKESEKKLAFLQLPSTLPRFVELKGKSGHHFMLLEQIIISFSTYLFPGLEIETAVPFRVTRDADIEIAEDEAEDLLSEVEEQVKERLWGRAAVRLEVSNEMPDYLLKLLI
jgi:polyphosphate kinase